MDMNSVNRNSYAKLWINHDLIVTKFDGLNRFLNIKVNIAGADLFF